MVILIIATTAMIVIDSGSKNHDDRNADNRKDYSTDCIHEITN